MRIILSALALVTLSGCDSPNWASIEASIANTDLLAETRRAFAASYQDQPFEAGAVSVVAEEHGELHTYSLTPCRMGARVCGGAGSAGHLQKTPDYDIVIGAYRDRVFYLSPGGDGYLRWRGAWHPLAWE